MTVLQWEPVPLNNAAMCANTCDKDCNFHTTWFSTMHFYFTDYTAVKCPPTYAKTLVTLVTTLVTTPAHEGGGAKPSMGSLPPTNFVLWSELVYQTGRNSLPRSPKKKWSSEPALGFDTPPCAGVLVAMKRVFGLSAP